MPKCAECGFLTTRHQTSRAEIEVETKTRETGQKTSNADIDLSCSRKAIRIDNECRAARDEFGHNQSLGVLQVIQTERECGCFFPWNPGRTPREHLDMVEAQILRESMERREAADREWREDQDRRRREYEAQQKEVERKFQLEQKLAEDKRRQDDKEADERRRQDEKEADRKWQLEQKESDRAWQKEQDYNRRFYGAVLAIITGIIGTIVGAILRGDAAK